MMNVDVTTRKTPVPRPQVIACCFKKNILISIDKVKKNETYTNSLTAVLFLAAQLF
jgi:hypothetical protein